MIIYLVHNKINHKNYVGQTIHSLKFRKRYYKYDQNLLSKALRKYGHNNFEWTVLKECNKIEELNFWEKFYIKLLSTTNVELGYNIREGGSNSPLSEQTKKKLSIINKGKIIPDEVKEKISKALKGRVMTNIHKQRMRENHSHYWQNRKLSSEHKAKISKYKQTEEQLKKMKENTSRGEKQGLAVLTNEIVKYIRTMKKRGAKTPFEVYKTFKNGAINRNTFYHVWHNTTWRHITV